MADVISRSIPFRAGDGGPEPREAVQCTSANAAIRGAGRIGRAEGNVGAVALSHTGDPVSGEFADSIVLKAFDDVPDDLSEL